MFIAGTIQGANRGIQVEDQGYRSRIAELFDGAFPNVECFDPSLDVLKQLNVPSTAEQIRELAVEPPRRLETSSLPSPLQTLRTTFIDTTQSVENFDLCVAYLPGHTPSMGTAMEMYAAHRSGVPVLTITDMVGNLAIASVSSWVLADLDALQVWLTDWSNADKTMSSAG
ncbi:hypothetical protein [Curtobacterium flaccumfaciens]|uniref:hypothetical protein n=1 Tax=Curtobacterium flaccumfaciens TaxID=2035 RepID=UPI0011759C8E|nr:hypothetical protein [Curtobacterium flaccumfaciens]TPG05162.1 hypothetical protein EAH85_14435 [Curtobacterium flaccumfaciens]